MNRTMKMLAVLVSMTVGSAVSYADAVIQARSDLPALVFLDGRQVGHTPLDIARVRRGSHEVRFHALGTNLEQSFVINAPRHSLAVTPVVAQFALAPACATPLVTVAPVVVTRPLLVVREPYYHHGHHRYWR